MKIIGLFPCYVLLGNSWIAVSVLNFTIMLNISSALQHDFLRNRFCTTRLLGEGDVRVCGDAVLRYFWCCFAVIFVLTRGIAVSKH